MFMLIKKSRIILFLALLAILISIGVSQVSLSSTDIKVSDCALYENITYYQETIDKQTSVYDPLNKNNTIITTYKLEPYNQTECTDKREVILISEKIIDVTTLQVGAVVKKDYLLIEDIYDGFPDGVIQPGESYCIVTDKVACSGYNAERIKSRLEGVGIE